MQFRTENVLLLSLSFSQGAVSLLGGVPRRALLTLVFSLWSLNSLADDKNAAAQVAKLGEHTSQCWECVYMHINYAHKP